MLTLNRCIGSSNMSEQKTASDNNSPGPQRLRLYALFNLALAILLGGWFWQQNQPVAMPAPQLAADEKLQCVSYAPYYKQGESPFFPDYKVSKQRIEQDLKLLAQRFHCVRTYSVGQGLDYVPEAAAKIGLKVLLGAWVGWEKPDNDIEVNLAIKRANEYSDTVAGLIIGNEVLLRQEQPKEVMRAYLEQAQRETEVPVTYAEVWEYWIQNKDLEDAVDYVTVHVLPYWEDDPQPIERAMDHAGNVMQKLDGIFTKPLFIGETGWPSVGRHRGESEPSRLNQARYLREFVLAAQQNGWNYNLIEAMDQPWKRILEGTVGGSWGLYDSDLGIKFDFTGDLSEREDGAKPIYWALAGMLIWLGLALLYAREKRLSAVLAMGLLGGLVGASALLQIEYLQYAARYHVEWLGLGAVILAGWLALGSIPLLIRNPSCAKAQQLMQLSLLGLLVGLAVASWYLIVDWRYRDFALVLYALPALQLSLGMYLLGVPTRNTWRIYYLFNALAVITALVAVAIEPNNYTIWLWAGITVLLAMASWPRRTRLSTVNS